MEKKPKKYSYHRDATLPKNGEIFVFGSNLAGRHGAGAAKAALLYGAKMGQGIGHFGQSYALPTKDERIRTLPIGMVRTYVTNFCRYAAANPQYTFFVTAIGTGLAGFKNMEIAPMFINAPTNCNFPEQWEIYFE